jgi:signal transduction histidine kinase
MPTFQPLSTRQQGRGLLFALLIGMNAATSAQTGTLVVAPQARTTPVEISVELPPGSYRFQVLAAGEDGNWKEYGAAQQFAPHTIAQTPWFRLLLVGLAGCSLWCWRRHRSRQAAAQAQSRLEERLDERHRIARELHDTLLQSVQGLILKVQAVALGLPPEKKALRDEIQAIVIQAISSLEEGRDRVQNLRLHGLHGTTLEAVLSEAADQFADEHLKEPPRIQVIGSARELHLIVEEELSAIGREALINSYRHAHRAIDIEVRYGHRHFSLSITDGGPGIPSAVLAAQGRAGRWGLQGMHERAEKIGAQLSVRSIAGKGTRVTVTLCARMAYQQKPWRWLPGCLRRQAAHR